MGVSLTCFRTALRQFIDQDCMTDAAAMAYYTIFSVPPLLVMVLLFAGEWGFSRRDVEEVIQRDLGFPTTDISADIPGVEFLDSNETRRPPTGDALQRTQAGSALFLIGPLGIGTKLVGILLFLFSATAIFSQLQAGLNKIWHVAPDPRLGGIQAFLIKRLLSVAMVIVIWFALLLSLVLTALISQVLGAIKGSAPDFVEQRLGLLINESATFVVAVLLFAAIYKILPDALLQWRDVWAGAILTAALFVVGKILIGWYLRVADIGSSWGASAASTAAALVWVYYSSLIVLLGAELTQVCATQCGTFVPPEPGAKHVEPPPAQL